MQEKSRNDHNAAAVQVLKKAVVVLECLSEYPKGLQLKDIVSKTDLNKSTVYRILDTYAGFGYVMQKADGRYRLGYKLFDLTKNLLDNDLIETAKPYLDKLSVDTDQVAHLVIRDGNEGVYIDKVDMSGQSIRLYSKIGSRLSLHCTSAGKVLLAGLPNEEAQEILSKAGLIRHTPFTITSSEALLEDLERVRTRGYALDDMENEENVRCVAAPIKGYMGKTIAAISVSSTILHFRTEDIPKIANMVIQCAKDISFELGCQNY